MDAEQSLECVVPASVRRVIARDDVDLIAFTRHGAVCVVTAEAERPEIVGQVVSEEGSAQFVVLPWSIPKRRIAAAQTYPLKTAIWAGDWTQAR